MGNEIQSQSQQVLESFDPDEQILIYDNSSQFPNNFRVVSKNDRDLQFLLSHDILNKFNDAILSSKHQNEQQFHHFMQVKQNQIKY